MKATIFNFFVLQAVVWAIVFSGGLGESDNAVNYAIISDTWKVANVGTSYNSEVILQYPAFNKLTLNIDGTYIRVKKDKTQERGNWALDKSKTMLVLSNETEIKQYEIIQLPDTNAQSFIIKEKGEELNSRNNLEYELTRM
jgi:hypothetical protein